MRRKSFSLVFLILIVTLVVFLVIVLVSLINKPKKETNTTNNQINKTIINKLDSSFIESLNDIASTDSNTSEGTSSQAQPQPTPQETNDQEFNSISLNNHNYKLSKTAQASIIDSATGEKEIKYELTDKNFTIFYGSNSEKTFQDFKSTQDLTEYIESKYGLSLTSKLKTGTINGLDLIICSASENSKPIYLLFTPLTDSEIAYAKIYNQTNENELLQDISDPLNEISSIILSKE